MTKALSFMTAAAAAICNIDAFLILPSVSRNSLILFSEKITSSSDVKIKSNILEYVTLNDKISIDEPTQDERGKGCIQVSMNVKALEVLARIPRFLAITSADCNIIPSHVVEAISNSRNTTWATELTAITLASLHPSDDITNNKMAKVKQQWISSWTKGGWGSDSDLGPDISSDCIGTLLATGTDNDKNIYAKFRMPAHPAIFKAAMGLSLLTKCTEAESLKALTARGFTYRSMRDALQELVLQSTQRDESKKGTVRDKRCWDVADTLDKVLSRVTTLQLEDTTTTAIVPIFERLSHSLEENSKLVSIGDEILLVATRDIEAGEAITRDYTKAPQLVNDDAAEGSALRLLLQFGLPPKAWPEEQ